MILRGHTYTIRTRGCEDNMKNGSVDFSVFRFFLVHRRVGRFRSVFVLNRNRTVTGHFSRSVSPSVFRRNQLNKWSAFISKSWGEYVGIMYVTTYNRMYGVVVSRVARVGCEPTRKRLGRLVDFLPKVYQVSYTRYIVIFV